MFLTKIKQSQNYFVMKKILVAILFLSVTHALNAQTTTMLSKGKAGFGANFGVVNSKNISGYLYELGFSYKRFSVDAEAMNAEYDSEDILTNNAESKMKGISASFWYIDSKLSEKINWKVGIAGVYESVDYDNYIYIGNTKPSNGSFLVKNYDLIKKEQVSFGLKSLINISLKGDWTLQQNVWLGHNFVMKELETPPDASPVVSPNQPIKDSDSGSDAIIGFAAAKQINDDFQVFISFKQYFGKTVDDNFSYLSGGIAFTL